MSGAWARRVLWLTLACVVPLPFFLVQTGAVPVVRLLELSAALAAIVIVEGTRGMIGAALALLMIQAVAYVAALYVVAAVASRAIATGSRRRTAAVTLVAVATAVSIAMAFDLYRTPFRTRSLQGNLSEILQ